VHGRSSSSPSDKNDENLGTVQYLTEERAGVSVTLTDGSSFLISSTDNATLSLTEGAQVSLADLSARAFRHELALARDKALELLARREHTGQEMAHKLEQRDYRPEVISECVAKLKDDKSIDEMRFAAYYVESRVRKSPRGRSAVLAELASRGVARDTAAAALQSYEREHPGAFDDALRRAFQKVRRDGAEPERIMQRLARRGFAAGEVQRIMSEHTGQT
jgi:regulatory protein